MGPTVADRTWPAQALAWRTTEPLHSSSAPVPEALASSLPTPSPSGCELLTPVSSLPTHSCRLSRARSAAETRSVDARSASRLSKLDITKLNYIHKENENSLTKLIVFPL